MEAPRSKQEHWTEHLNAWRASGLTQAAYCARHGLRPATFAYWAAKARKAAKEAAPLTLVPLKVGAGSAGPVLSGTGGWRLELPNEVAAAWLAELLRRLP